MRPHCATRRITHGSIKSASTCEERRERIARLESGARLHQAPAAAHGRVRALAARPAALVMLTPP